MKNKILFRSFATPARAFLAGVLLSSLAACGGSSAPPTDAEGWLVLFDGSDLDHWTVLGDANWSVEDGAVGADQSTAASFLVSNDSYTDFDLELEFWVDTDANSGVFLRCQNPESISDTSCYEANIFDTRSDQTYRTGSIVNVAEPEQFVYTGGQWNRYEISAHGNHLMVTLNGHTMVDVEDDQFASGPIALQYGQGVVKFRNVRLRAQ
ncbi:MAG: 3-keto-disaccharide hydrolase [Gammaproteobacteria bacterium]